MKTIFLHLDLYGIDLYLILLQQNIVTNNFLIWRRITFSREWIWVFRNMLISYFFSQHLYTKYVYVAILFRYFSTSFYIDYLTTRFEHFTIAKQLVKINKTIANRPKQWSV